MKRVPLVLQILHTAATHLRRHGRRVMPVNAPRPSEASDQPAAVAHQLAVGQLVHLAPSLDAAWGDAEPAVRRARGRGGEDGGRAEPGPPPPGRPARAGADASRALPGCTAGWGRAPRAA